MDSKPDLAHSRPQESSFRSPSYYSLLPNLPSLTLQRPSYPSHLPPFQYLRPVSTTHPSSSHSPPRPPLFRSASSSSASASSVPRLISPIGRLPSIHRSPASTASDLARYAMTKDEKARTEDEVDKSASPHSLVGRTLPPLESLANGPGESSQRSPSIRLAEEDLPKREGGLLPLLSLTDNRKRKELERDVLPSPGTPNSCGSSSSTVESSQLVSPHLNEPPFKRRGSASRMTAKDVDPFDAYQSNYMDKMANFPIPPQEPITLFPVSTYTWPPSETSPTSGGPLPPMGGIAIDPVLSSVRSGQSPTIIPDVRFPDGDEIASPALGGTEGEASGSQNDLLSPGDKLGKDAPFSRSPELRVSHKLAERKRRKEMKDLFDELREQLPADRGMKASKWEILSKAVDFISHMKAQHADMIREIEGLRRDLEIARTNGPQATPYPTASYYSIPAPYPPQGSYPAGTTQTSGTASQAPPPTAQPPRSS
ncbi:hypothetical protein P7C73_g4019, partial [Tremellales sp. Uapishka_1]